MSGSSHLSSVLRRLAFTLAPVVLLLAGAEIGTRIANPPQPFNIGGPLGWTAQPNLTDFLVDQRDSLPDFYVSTNADGLRTNLPRKRDGVHRRIVILGDSTVFGWGQSIDDALPGSLQRFLGEQWEVLDGGQPGFTSEQVSGLAETLIPAYSPDGVVYVQPWNDFARAPSSDQDSLALHPAQVFGDLLWSHSAFLRWSWARRAEALGMTSQSPLMFGVGGVLMQGGVLRVSPERRKENIRRIQAAITARGGWMLVANLPSQADPIDTTAQVAEHAAICSALGLPFLDLSEELSDWSNADAAQPGDCCHYTALANIQFGSRLAASVRTVAPD